MSTWTLSIFNTGQVTLPKKWRDRAGTTKFLAEEFNDGLLIRPIRPTIREDNISFHENKNGCGLIFHGGISPSDLLRRFDKFENMPANKLKKKPRKKNG